MCMSAQLVAVRTQRKFGVTGASHERGRRGEMKPERKRDHKSSIGRVGKFAGGTMRNLGRALTMPSGHDQTFV